MIQFVGEDVKIPIEKKRNTKNWIKAVVESHGCKVGDLTFIFCSDEYLLQVNIQYLEHDYYTDIITFDYCEDQRISGDLFISVDTVRSNAEKFNQSFRDECDRVIIHGVLHLLGFKDKTDVEALEMRKMEEDSLLLR